MLFKRREKDDYSEIKDAIEEPTSYKEYDEEPLMEKPVISAPLFVKIDKYRDVISGIQEMKLFISNIKQVFGVLHETESIRSDALKVMRASIQRLEKSVLEIDSELVRPKGIDLEDLQGKEEIGHIENSLTDLQKQLGDLKRELQDMR
ncbi:MAG: hypothetical protein HYT73_01370 [Candidatus Aenigmarchaeota archaeon]|nr:hypothetical protein [Candidatus Aenigmarchaeota archaeon]